MSGGETVPTTLVEWSQALGPLATLVVATVAAAVALRDTKWRKRDREHLGERAANQVTGKLTTSPVRNTVTGSLEVIFPALEVANYTSDALRSLDVEVCARDKPDRVYARAQLEYVAPTTEVRVDLSPVTPCHAQAERVGAETIYKPPSAFFWHIRWRDSTGQWWKNESNKPPERFDRPPGEKRWVQVGQQTAFTELPDSPTLPDWYEAPERASEP